LSDAEERPPEEKQDKALGTGGDAEPAKPRPTRGRDNLPRPEDEEVVKEYTFVSPKGHRYRILRTRDRDVYERPEPSPTDESEPVEETNSEKPDE
jgi:hypothetical protein